MTKAIRMGIEDYCPYPETETSNDTIMSSRKMNRKQYRRYHSLVIAAEREKVEAELKAMNPLEPEVRHFLSFEGFAELYLRMRDLYPTQLEAYERLEDFYITITGKRRYSDSVRFEGC